MATEEVSLNFTPVKYEYQPATTETAEDSFDFKAAEEEEVALLLPAVQMAREASTTEDYDLTAGEDDGTAYKYELTDVIITSYDTHGTADSGHDEWIDILAIDWGTHQPTATDSDADMSSDFIF